MKCKKMKAGLHGATLLAALCLSTQANAVREGEIDVTLFSPYQTSESVDFDGGASADLDSSAGFGFGVAYNYTNNLAVKAEFSWNSFGYEAHAVLEDDYVTVDFRGEMDNLTLLFGGDYYLTRGQLSPFINANFGWSWLDSNIPKGRPSTGCWWDPWWGYVCSSYQNTHSENSMFYGLGLGARFDISRKSFVKVGYYETWMDWDNIDGSASLSTFKFEFGWSF